MKQIVVVDDDELMREILVSFLRKEHYRVYPYKAPEAALAAVLADSPDLIVSDVKMPGMNGLELIGQLRAMGIVVAVIFLTGNPTDDLHHQANQLGVGNILTKPLKDLSVLGAAVKSALSCPGYAGIRAGLDELRVGFLIKLAHELRTPVTALRLALDELSGGKSAAAAAGPESRERLLVISRRNLDRIESLVENQIELLQVALGRVTLSRRLVEIGEVFRKSHLSEAVAENSGVFRTGRDRVVLYTDPDRLAEAIYWLGRGRGDDDTQPAQFELEHDRAGARLTIICRLPRREFEPEARLRSRRCERGESSFCPIPLLSEAGLEMRASRTLIEALGGDLTVMKQNGNGLLRIRLPIFPAFNRTIDFIRPLKQVRELAQLNGQSLDLVKCELSGYETGEGDGLASLYELIRNSYSALAECDRVVRGKSNGTCYLALLDRRPEDIDHTMDYLRRNWADFPDPGKSIDVMLLQRVTPDMKDIDNITRSLETLP
jgi:two-component system response regulator (stage 0 sporulation protein F)